MACKMFPGIVLHFHQYLGVHALCQVVNSTVHPHAFVAEKSFRRVINKIFFFSYSLEARGNFLLLIFLQMGPLKGYLHPQYGTVSAENIGAMTEHVENKSRPSVYEVS